jgi:hypothetical protein
MKDVAMPGGYQEITFDFVANDLGMNVVPLPPKIAHGFWIHDAIRLRVS